MPSWRKGRAMTYKEVIARIASIEYRLNEGLVPEEQIEAVTALKDGMRHGLDVLRSKEYDSGNSRRQAIRDQKARNG